MKYRMLLVFVAGALLCSAVAYGHHSYGATYDITKEIRLEGKLVQFVFRNPHSFVHVQAPDSRGTMQRWAVEWSGTSQLGSQGISRDSLRIGDDLVIVGRPSRVAGEYRVLMVSLARSQDGFSWGSRPGEVVD